MDYDIKVIGFNLEKSNKSDKYKFYPFSKTNSSIQIIPKKECVIKFLIKKDKMIDSINICRLNKKIMITDKKTKIKIKCSELIPILIIPNISTKKCKITIEKIGIFDIIEKPLIKNKEIEIKMESNMNTLNTSVEITQITYKIFTSRWGIKIAESLSMMLKDIGYTSKIVESIGSIDYKNNRDMPNEYYILLFPHLVRLFPPPNKCIIFQLEQKKQSGFVTPKILQIISNTIMTLDYSMENIQDYSENLSTNKVRYFPMPILNKLDTTLYDIQYDIIFYGSITHNSRRKNIITKLKEKYNILFVHNIFGEKLYEIIKKSKIILNIHVYQNSILETARINEVIPFNKLVISELPDPADSVNKELYNNTVVYCDTILPDLSNISSMYAQIDYYLDPINYANFISNNKTNIEKIYLNSKSYLEKHLASCNLHKIKEIANHENQILNVNTEFDLNYISNIIKQSNVDDMLIAEISSVSSDSNSK
jgi:hypothetical protein